ncbi:WecB/TagA/CpsF family glycosyltransferase [Haliea sp.]
MPTEENVFTSPALVEFAGTALAPSTLAELLAWLQQRWHNGERGLLLGHHNLHSLVLCQREPTVREFYRSCQRCYVDGVAVLWLLRAAGFDTSAAQRFTLMDSLPTLLEWLQSANLSVYYLGGSPLAAERARAWLARDYPQLRARLQHGYDLAEAETISAINQFRPDLLLVGMGMPRQEAWLLRHRAQLDAGAMLQAGGTLDYYTGLQARPPLYLSRIGLGGLYRLLLDPRRLWYRYLVTPWSLLWPTVKLRRALAQGRR